jgi:hypothetical protein
MSTPLVMDRERYCPPAASLFTTIVGSNAEVPTIADTVGRGLKIDFGVSPVAASENARLILKPKTTLTTTYSIIARICTSTLACRSTVSGLCVSDGTKCVVISMGLNTVDFPGLYIRRYTSPIVLNSNLIATNGEMMKVIEWLRIDVTAGDPSKYYISDNGTDWILLLSQSQTAFLTYTHVGFVSGINRTSGPLPVAGTNQLSTSVMYFSDPDVVPPV